MPWQITGLLFSCVFELVMLFLVRGRLRTSTAGPFCLGLLFNAFWALGYATELSTPEFADKLLVFQIRCSFLCFYAPVWLEMVFRMTRGRVLLRGWTLAAVLIVPVVTLALIWLPGPGQNPLLRHSFFLGASDGFPVLRNTLGPWGILYYVFNYAVWGLVFILLYPRKNHTAWERRGRLIFLGAAMIGWTTDASHLFGLTSPAGLNYAPILFPITSALIAFALLRHRLLDLAPVARAALLEHLEDRIIVLDEDNRIVDYNQPAQGTLALPGISALGQPATEILAGQPNLVSMLGQSGDQRAELVIDASIFEASLFAVHAADDTRTRARVLVLKDITRGKETERQLRLAKDAAEAAGRAQSRFLATMSHEIRTPMNGVVGFTQLLKDTSLSPEQREYLDLIDHSSRSLLVIINDVLDYSKIAANQLEIERVRCDLGTTAAQTNRLLQPLAAEKNIELITFIDPAVPSLVMSDPVRIQQIITNLIGNGIKFTLAGKVSLEIGVGGTDLVSFKVTDTGIGIAPDQHSRVFIPFSQADASTTRRFGGTGLGLSITRRLCELMGGSLTMQSEPGKGSVFTATVKAPAAAPEPQVQPLNGTDGLPSAMRSLNLLVFEDNMVNKAVIRAFLTRLGHRASFVEDGQKGLAILASEKFDALLMDLEMPVMDGYETVRRIRTSEADRFSRAYIIAVTAHALKGERERCLALGMDDFLTKPISLPALIETLSRIPARAQ